jgi:ATP-dependent Clp protease ATP-binding subunit ClpB
VVWTEYRARSPQRAAGIPLTKLVESEASRLLHLSDELHKRIVGQHEAVGAISEAIQRSRHACVCCVC